MRILSLPWMMVGIVAATVPEPMRGQETDKTPGRWNVLDFGAKADGSSDDTLAIQSALDAAGAAGGGVVSLPTGTFLLEGRLSVPDNVALEGVFRIPTAWSQYKGTTLCTVVGEGSEEGDPFISLNQNSTVKGLAVFYPNQDDPKKIKPYPWCIAGTGKDRASFRDAILRRPKARSSWGRTSRPQRS